MSILPDPRDTQLTHHEKGSIRELWAISFPLILSILSTNAMTFFDRLILAKYDIQAMNAAVIAGLAANIFQYSVIGIASISEVFVGQYNGAKKLKKMGEPVWQMIWFSAMTLLLFVPLALWGGAFFIPNPEYQGEGIPFFKWLMLFGPSFPLVTALSSFFIGRGRVKLVMVSTVLSNVLNIALDFMLIFGLPGIIPSMGAKGAAIATGIAQTLQALILFGVFLRRDHREGHGTGRWHLNLGLFLKTLYVGLPNCLSNLIELSAWYVLAQVLASISEAHITVFSIGDSFFVLFAFGFWGLQKGITTVAANYIGADREELLSKTLYSGIKIILMMMLFLIIPMFYYSDWLTEQFLNPEDSLVLNEEVKDYMVIAMRWIWAYCLFDAITWLICGILTAAGDTRFVMVMNGISAWLFSVIPTYFFVVYIGGSPVISWILLVLYGFLNATSFYLRYKSRRWSSEQPLHVFG